MLTKQALSGNPEKIHTPAIYDLRSIAPETRAQPTFAQTTAREASVHNCVHTPQTPNSHAVSLARGTQ